MRTTVKRLAGRVRQQRRRTRGRSKKRRGKATRREKKEGKHLMNKRLDVLSFTHDWASILWLRGKRGIERRHSAEKGVEEKKIRKTEKSGSM